MPPQVRFPGQMPPDQTRRAGEYATARGAAEASAWPQLRSEMRQNSILYKLQQVQRQVSAAVLLGFCCSGGVDLLGSDRERPPLHLACRTHETEHGTNKMSHIADHNGVNLKKSQRQLVPNLCTRCGRAIPIVLEKEIAGGSYMCRPYAFCTHTYRTSGAQTPQERPERSEITKTGQKIQKK